MSKERDWTEKGGLKAANDAAKLALWPELVKALRWSTDWAAIHINSDSDVPTARLESLAKIEALLAKAKELDHEI